MKIPLDRADLRLVYSSNPDAAIKVASLNHENTELAESDDPEELESFEALIELAHAASTPLADATQETIEIEKEETSWVSCVSCGRPLAPSAEKIIQCRACGASNPVPEPVRTGVEAEGALAETRVRTDDAVQGLLDQPRPLRVNLALWLCSIPVVVTWPVLGAFFDEFYQCRGVFHWTHGIPIFFGGVGLSVGGLMFVRAQIEGRIAHRVLVTAFRASRPTAPGAPWTCGQCGGPLPEIGRDRVVVRCLYCRTDQILGVDLPGRVLPARQNARDLENELRYRTDRRRRYRRLGTAAIGIALLGGLLLREPLRIAFAAPSRNTKCVQTPTDITPAPNPGPSP